MLHGPINRPAWALLLSGIVVALALLSVRRITPSTTLEPLFDQRDPAAVALHKATTDFAMVDELLLLVSVPEGHTADPLQLRAFSGRLRAQIEQNQALARIISAYTDRTPEQAREYAERVIAPAAAYYLNDSQFEELLRRLTLEGMRSRIKRNEALLAGAAATNGALSEAALRDPLGLHELLLQSMDDLQPLTGSQQGDGLFTSLDGRSLLIRIAGTDTPSNIEFTQQFMNEIRSTVAAAQPGGLELAYSGGYAIAELSAKEIRADSIRSVLGSLLLLQCLFLMVYRRAGSFLLALAPVGVGVLCAFGVYALFDPTLTPITAVIGAMLTGLGVDYAIHYMSHYQTHRAAGLTASEAAAATLRIGWPMIAACGTSLIGFGAIIISGVPALRGFAALGILGLTGTLIATFTVLPALLGCTARWQTEKTSRLNMSPLVHWITRHTRTVMLCMGVLFALTLTWLMNIPGGPVRFATDLDSLHPRPNPPLDTQQRIGRLYADGGETEAIYLRADSPRGLLLLAHEVQRRLHDQTLHTSGIQTSLSLASLLPDPVAIDARRDALNALEPDAISSDFDAAIQESIFKPEAYRDYGEFLQQLLRPGDPPAVDALIDFPQLAAPLLPRSVFKDKSTPTQALTFVAVSPQADVSQLITAVRSALADLPGATLFGQSVLRHDTEHAIRHDLLWMLLLAMPVVGVWLILTFRRVDAVLLSLLPVCFGAVGVLAALQLAGGGFDMVNLVALPLLVGIGVDDGIILVSTVMSGRRRAAWEDLIACCHAITMTTMTTVLAFGSLCFTSVPAIRTLGLVMAVGVGAAWIGTMGALVPILMRHVTKDEL